MGLGIMFTYPDSVDGIKELKDDLKKQAFPGAKAIASKLITCRIKFGKRKKEPTSFFKLDFQHKTNYFLNYETNNFLYTFFLYTFSTSLYSGS